MDDYLSRRREQEETSYYEALKENTSNFFGRIKMVFKKEEDFEQESIQESEFEKTTEEYEEPEKKLSLFSRIFRFNRVKEENFEEDYDDYQEENLEEQLGFEDYKEAIKILHKWVEKLPENDLKKFKSSSDFDKYKKALKKLGMIK